MISSLRFWSWNCTSIGGTRFLSNVGILCAAAIWFGYTCRPIAAPTSLTSSPGVGWILLISILFLWPHFGSVFQDHPLVWLAIDSYSLIERFLFLRSAISFLMSLINLVRESTFSDRNWVDAVISAISFLSDLSSWPISSLKLSKTLTMNYFVRAMLSGADLLLADDACLQSPHLNSFAARVFIPSWSFALQLGCINLSRFFKVCLLYWPFGLLASLCVTNLT